jgi:hypothetical protein
MGTFRKKEKEKKRKEKKREKAVASGNTPRVGQT